MITILVAMDSNRVIGHLGQIPWDKKSEDLKRFRARTLYEIVVMGRVTWEGLLVKGIVLDKRIVVVLSKSGANTLEDVILYGKRHRDKNIYICGGASIYEQALASREVEQIIVSLVDGTYLGDRYLPELDPSEWKESKRERFDGFTEIIYK